MAAFLYVDWGHVANCAVKLWTLFPQRNRSTDLQYMLKWTTQKVSQITSLRGKTKHRSRPVFSTDTDSRNRFASLSQIKVAFYSLVKLVDFSLYFGNRFEKKRREKKKEKPILNFHPVGGGRRPFCKALVSKSTLLSVAGWETFTIPTNKQHRRACSPPPPSSLLTLHISRRTFHPVFLKVLICLFLMATWILIAWIRNARRNRRYKRYFFFCIGQISGPLADCAVLVLIIQTPHFSLFDPQCLTQFYKSTTYSFFFLPMPFQYTLLIALEKGSNVKIV